MPRDLIWKLYLEYEAEIKMESRFDLIEEFTTQFPTSITLKNTWHTTTSISAKMAYIDSESGSDALELQYQVTGTIVATEPSTLSFVRRDHIQKE